MKNWIYNIVEIFITTALLFASVGLWMSPVPVFICVMLQLFIFCCVLCLDWEIGGGPPELNC